MSKIGPHGGGMRTRYRLLLYAVIAAVGAWWFYYKLGWDTFHVPFIGDVMLGWWYVPVFIAVIVGTSFSVNQTDGLDGLAGGTLLTSFGAFAAIAFCKAVLTWPHLSGAIIGALLAFCGSTSTRPNFSWATPERCRWESRSASWPCSPINRCCC